METKKDPNKKHYFQQVTLEEFAEVMKMHCELESARSLTIWEKGEDQELAEVYEAVSYYPYPKVIKLNPTGKLLTKITGSTKTGKQVLVKIPIDDKLNYFTGGRLKFHSEDLTYSLEIQQEIYKSQARSTFRLIASAVIPIQFKIDEQVFEAFDLSIGGTSLVVPESELERFPKGKLFTDCVIRFDRKNYHIPFAQVAVQIPLEPTPEQLGKMFKIGFSFKDLPHKTQDEFLVKITTEARGLEMKTKFDSLLPKKVNE